jgi:hypothetical protein
MQEIDYVNSEHGLDRELILMPGDLAQARIEPVVDTRVVAPSGEAKQQENPQTTLSKRLLGKKW